jgi:hypothetical protein
MGNTDKFFETCANQRNHDWRIYKKNNAHK